MFLWQWVGRSGRGWVGVRVGWRAQGGGQRRVEGSGVGFCVVVAAVAAGQGSGVGFCEVRGSRAGGQAGVWRWKAAVVAGLAGVCEVLTTATWGVQVSRGSPETRCGHSAERVRVWVGVVWQWGAWGAAAYSGQGGRGVAGCEGVAARWHASTGSGWRGKRWVGGRAGVEWQARRWGG